MSLSPGMRFGGYEVLAKIGEGGMGEVYRARDTRLKRDIALKLLPETLAADPERLARFQREAEVLASLNHPNIAAIHGIEDSGGIRALVLELVDGPTLADRIAQAALASGSRRSRGLPFDEALAIARQIAEALQAAHERGVIHRDLKPANIKVRADGTVKVLDFGLAKAMDPAAGAGTASGAATQAALSQFPTMMSPAHLRQGLGGQAETVAGLILGTPSYMAPEQAKGKTVDQRADLWAFGCLLFEMLTGQRPFHGDEVSDVLAAILRSDPPWGLLPQSVSPAIRRLLVLCLKKDPKKRLQTAADALLRIDEVALDAEEVRTSSRPSSLRPFVMTAVFAALFGGGAVLLWAMTRAQPAASVVRTTLPTSGEAVLSVSGNDRDLVISPDGSRVAYRGPDGILAQSLDSLPPAAVMVSGVGARGLFISPDGQWVGYVQGAGSPAMTLRKAPMAGGSAVAVAVLPGTGPRGAAWIDDATIVAATNAPSGLLRIPAAGGEADLLTTPDISAGELDHVWPEAIPGTNSVLFTVELRDGSRNVAVFDLASGTSKVLLRGGTHARYVPTGHLVYGDGGSLRAVAFSRETQQVLGTPVPIVEGVMQGQFGAMNFDFAANGTMVYVPGGPARGPQRTLVWVDREGREEPLGAPPRAYAYPRISPDGTRVALDVRDEEFDIWIWDFQRRTLTRLTSNPLNDQYPIWTPDSRELIFTSNFEHASGIRNLFRQAADGTGTAERLTRSENDQEPYSLTPDGRWIVFNESTSAGDDSLLMAPIDGSLSARGGDAGALRTLISTRFSEYNAEFSPDGRWLAYESTESGREEVYVRPFPDVDSGRWQISTHGGKMPLWARSGRELFYVASDGVIMTTPVGGGTSWQNSAPVRLVSTRFQAGNNTPARPFDISPDGKRFLMVKGESAEGEGSAPQVIVVQNWFEELKRLVPAGR